MVGVVEVSESKSSASSSASASEYSRTVENPLSGTVPLQSAVSVAGVVEARPPAGLPPSKLDRGLTGGLYFSGLLFTAAPKLNSSSNTADVALVFVFKVLIHAVGPVFGGEGDGDGDGVIGVAARSAAGSTGEDM